MKLHDSGVNHSVTSLPSAQIQIEIQTVEHLKLSLHCTCTRQRLICVIRTVLIPAFLQYRGHVIPPAGVELIVVVIIFEGSTLS